MLFTSLTNSRSQDERMILQDLRRLDEYQIAFIRNGLGGVAELAFFKLRMGGCLEEITRDEQGYYYCVYRGKATVDVSTLNEPEREIFTCFSTFRTLSEVITDFENRNPAFLSRYRNTMFEMGLLRRTHRVCLQINDAILALFMVAMAVVGGCIATVVGGRDYSSICFGVLAISVIIISSFIENVRSQPSFFNSSDMGDLKARYSYVKTGTYHVMQQIINDHYFQIQEQSIYFDVIERAKQSCDYFAWMEELPATKYLSIKATGTVL